MSAGWCDWVVEEVKKEGYNAVLFPGDLIDGTLQNLMKELKVVLDMLTALSEMDIPILLCTGNHDEGLIEHLLTHREQVPTISPWN